MVTGGAAAGIATPVTSRPVAAGRPARADDGDAIAEHLRAEHEEQDGHDGAVVDDEPPPHDDLPGLGAGPQDGADGDGGGDGD